MRVIKQVLLVVLSVILMACAELKPRPDLDIAAIPETELLQVTGSRFNRFVVKDPKEFAAFNQVILYPMQFHTLKIAQEADKSLVESWNDSNWAEMDTICEQFDIFAQKIFKEQKGLKPATKGGENVLAVEFRLVRFMPYSKRYKDAALGSLGSSSDFTGIGEVTIRAVLANAKKGTLVGVIEDTIEVNAGNMVMGNLNSLQDTNNKAAQMRAWRVSFKRWVSNFHKELRQLQQAPQSAQAVVAQ